MEIENKKNEKINKFISYSVKLYIEKSNFTKLIKEPNNEIEKECYLVNKNVFDELMKEICFNEINKLLNQKKELVIKNESNNQNLNKIINE